MAWEWVTNTKLEYRTQDIGFRKRSCAPLLLYRTPPVGVETVGSPPEGGGVTTAMEVYEDGIMDE